MPKKEKPRFRGLVLSSCYALLLLSFSFAHSVGAESVSPEAVVQEALRVTIGGAFALSGNAVTFGKEELQGAQLAVEEVNRKGKLALTLSVEDTQSTGLGATTAIKRLVEAKGMTFVVGPTWLDSFQGALPIAQAKGALLITPSAGVSNFKKTASDFPLVLSTYFSFEREVIEILAAVRSEGHSKVALLFDLDPYFQGMRELAEKHAGAHGLTVTGVQSFDPGASDFRAILAQVKYQGADAVLFGSVDQQSVLSFFRQRHEARLKARVYGTHDLEGYRGNQAFARFWENLVYVVPKAASPSFVARYRERFGEAPLMSAANSYDAVMFLAQALEAGRRSAQEVKDFIVTREFASETFGAARFSPLGGILEGEFDVVTIP